MNYNEKKYNYNNEYKKRNYKRIPFDVPIPDYERIKNAAVISKQSVNGFIKDCIFLRLSELEKTGTIPGKAETDSNRTEPNQIEPE